MDKNKNKYGVAPKEIRYHITQFACCFWCKHHERVGKKMTLDGYEIDITECTLYNFVNNDFGACRSFERAINYD